MKNLELENTSYENKLISNDSQKIITEIKRLLLLCDEFYISVAFITQSGISLLKYELKNLEEKNIPGKIITGDYLNFTQPNALSELMKYSNIKLKLYTENPFHTKGYYFKIKNKWTFIVGSSNLTQNALTINKEWNLKINVDDKSSVKEDMLEEFYKLYNDAKHIEDEFEEYTKRYNENKKNMYENKISVNVEIKPNEIQKEAINKIDKLRKTGEKKALIISATGTGKTYLSAFDVKQLNPKRTLFIVHRKTIAKKALDSFKKIMPNKSMELYNGKYLDVDILFATIQTINLKHHLEKFKSNFFDYIIIDEVHHIGGKTYQKVIDYFKPTFLLGMTATPERRDDFNIFKLFDNNIAYEIRLHDALRLKYLCPFNYFGISDIEIDGENVSEKSSFNLLTSDARVKHIIKNSNYYGYEGDVRHCLIFASSILEAQELNKKINILGYKSNSLTGEDSEQTREKTIKEFEEGICEFIITVDIFNEGIDIPCINQIIFLRATESATIYIQQMGRGLRHYKNKNYLVILDFIGNYEKNFLIPIALSENGNYDKDQMESFILNGSNELPGASTITFEEVTREKILKQIRVVNLGKERTIKRDYETLKNRLNKIPLLCDFENNKLISPNVILEKYNSYIDLIQKYEKINLNLSKEELNLLLYVYKVLTPAPRIHEVAILKYLKDKSYTTQEIISMIEKDYELKEQKDSTLNAIKHLKREIFNSFSEQNKYKSLIFEKENKLYLQGKTNIYLEDALEYNLIYLKENKKIQNDLLGLHKQYKKNEAYRLLNLDYSNGHQVKGYTFNTTTKQCLLFINFDDMSSFSNYDNILKSDNYVNWYFSKTNKGTMNENEKELAKGKYKIYIFARKNKSIKYYYLGNIKKVDKIIKHEIENKIVLEFKFILKNKIKPSIYNYLKTK